ncbi:hypothetical protein FA13DRAFT_1870847 [Coprinellus micaceus]|uniref:Uncharacterized protein n=1 Tax=Coprinellus micaceus TaxID=71717 RepID=A0A4Y7S9N5_COPMI|nr:hypothetical protein FA13DRAFT_1870847 [Coprinellus micaceus]
MARRKILDPRFLPSSELDQGHIRPRFRLGTQTLDAQAGWCRLGLRAHAMSSRAVSDTAIAYLPRVCVRRPGPETLRSLRMGGVKGNSRSTSDCITQGSARQTHQHPSEEACVRSSWFVGDSSRERSEWRIIPVSETHADSHGGPIDFLALDRHRIVVAETRYREAREWDSEAPLFHRDHQGGVKNGVKLLKREFWSLFVIVILGRMERKRS